MKQSGFSLIEIMIALAISAMLSLILYNAFTQSNKLVQQVRDLIDENSDTISTYAQIEKDFTGIFMPAEESISKGKTETPPANPATAAQQPTPAKKVEQDTEKKVDIVPFVTKTSDGKLGSISFVTTSILTIFNEATPHLARVTYRFKPQANEQGIALYTLMREEAPYDQKAETEKKAADKKATHGHATHAYALVRNISSYSVKFAAFNCKKDDTQELISLTEWGTDEQKKKAAELKLPEFVELKLEVMDLRTQRTTEMSIAVTIPAARCQQCKVAETKKPTPAPAAPPTQVTPPVGPPISPGKPGAGQPLRVPGNPNGVLNRFLNPGRKP